MSSLIEKLSCIQQQIKAPKNLKNSFGGYMYRNAEGILEAVKPYEEKYKVAFLLQDEMMLVGERYYVKAIATILDTETDQTIAATAYAREAETKKGMDESQITGTASSYARKYALNGLLLLDDTKDADTDEFQKEQKQEAATAAQKNTIREICEKHKIDILALYASNNLDEKTLTAIQAGQILSSFKKKYGDD